MQSLIDGIEAVAFDLDGTLIDTAPDLGAAANAMLGRLGHAPLADEIFPGMIGDGIDKFVARVLAHARRDVSSHALQSTSVALFKDLYGRQLFDRSRIYPGAAEALRALRQFGITLCCITNKESRFALPLLEAAGLADLLSLTLCADRAEDRKPRPTLLHAACRRLGLEPRQLLFVGDSPADVAAARSAGCRVVAVAYGYHRSPSPARSDAIVSSLLEITALDWKARAGAGAPRAAR